MGAIEVRCRQCGWGTRVAADGIPRYGARLRCPRCDALQLVLPEAASEPAAAEPQLSAAGDEPAAAEPQVGAARQEPARVEAESDHGANGLAPVEPEPGAPAVGMPGQSARARAEARRILRLWLQELARRGGAPVDARRVFGEHAEELARLYSLWSVLFPGEPARAIFRQELLAALGALAGDPGARAQRAGG